MRNNGFIVGIALYVAVRAVTVSEGVTVLPLRSWCLVSRAGHQGEKLDVEEAEQR